MNDVSDIGELRQEAATTPQHPVWAKGGPVFSHLKDDTVMALEGSAIATFGDAAVLGFWAFATGIWITGLFQTNIAPLSERGLLFPSLLIYAGVVLFMAGLFLYRRNNLFFATTFCSFAAFNITHAVLLLCQLDGLLQTSPTANLVVGCLTESFAYISLSLLIGAMQMNVVLVLMLGCTFIGYALGGLPFLTAATAGGGWAAAGRIGGYFLFAAGVFAYYGGTALLVNTSWRRPILPIGGQA